MRPSDEIEREVRTILRTVFLTDADVERWLTGVVPALRGRRPVDVLLTADREEVAQLVYGIRDGAFI